ncbi:MAG: DUF1194 domain-containing protein [Hyphomicrobiaceae bacterium]
MRTIRAITGVALLIILTVFIAGAAAAQTMWARAEVDLKLVLAVDVSWSMDPDEQRLQRDGYVQAFRDPQVIKAIKSGPQGRIAITYIEWAGPNTHFVVKSWTMIDGAAAADAFAAELAEREINRHRMTSISSILEFSTRQLEAAPFTAPRQVIDVSGDGPNNSGPGPINKVRDAVVERGIIINGLPIMLKSSNEYGFGWGQNLSDLDIYYTACVIGGPGSFVIPIRELSEFSTATRQKLLLEISDLVAPRQPRKLGSLVRRAQHKGPLPIAAPPGNGRASYDCEIGEKNWRRNWDRF